MSKIKYLGHASLKIKTNDGVVVYVDPFIGDDYKEEADVVLISHEHADHNKLELVPLKSDAVVIRQNTLKTGNIYNKTSIHGIEIEVVEAYNRCHDKSSCVGFVLRFDGKVIYISGDTSTTDDMRVKLPKYDIDYAFLCCDGIYNMDVNEAISVANLIHAKHVIPYHTNPSVIFDLDVASSFEYENKLIVQNGEEIDLC